MFVLSYFFFFKQKTAYEMRISDWSSDVCSSDLNFYVLKTYNESDLYALFVGHLADRLAADGRIRGAWGTKAGFSRGDLRAMQQRLVAQIGRASCRERVCQYV